MMMKKMMMIIILRIIIIIIIIIIGTQLKFNLEKKKTLRQKQSPF
jgi:uncharacterized alpha/beta hydrolase family protein